MLSCEQGYKQGLRHNDAAEETCESIFSQYISFTSPSCFDFANVDAVRNFKFRYKLFYHLPACVEAEDIRVKLRKQVDVYSLYIDIKIHSLSVEENEENCNIITKVTTLPSDCNVQRIKPALRIVQWDQVEKKILEIEIAKL